MSAKKAPCRKRPQMTKMGEVGTAPWRALRHLKTCYIDRVGVLHQEQNWGMHVAVFERRRAMKKHVLCNVNKNHVFYCIVVVYHISITFYYNSSFLNTLRCCATLISSTQAAALVLHKVNNCRVLSSECGFGRMPKSCVLRRPKARKNRGSHCDPAKTQWVLSSVWTLPVETCLGLPKRVMLGVCKDKDMGGSDIFQNPVGMSQTQRTPQRLSRK